ncbi:MAG TPA: alpha/beta fold hydrolase, partial [Pyrinomonadaceae bacterium]|nr:alpha/beta fold hydrolase [Pyrinomonadaceae bacterium]
VLDGIKLRASVYGRLNDDKSNAVLVFHALTGSSRIHEWWPDLVGEGRALDTSQNAVICVNYIGSCYGSTPAEEIESVVTTRDIVRSQVKVLEHLGIRKLRAVVGGSVGGMLALQLAADHPDLTEKCIAIGATPLSAMGLALNHIQRRALDIENGVHLARQLATISYKSAEAFDERFARNPNRNGERPHERFDSRFDIAGYLDYQGDVFTKRFEPASYRLITKAMDLFDLTDDEIARIKAKVSLIGISSDWLFPAADVLRLANRLYANDVDAEYIDFESPDGHDAFLSDTTGMSRVLKGIFNNHAAWPPAEYRVKQFAA